MSSKPTQKRRNIGALGRGLLDPQFAALRKLGLIQFPGGSWIRVIRELLGMNTRQLAARIGVSQPRVSAIEKAEAEGLITLKTLRSAAEGLNCTLVYALVPNEPLDAMVRQRAKVIAEARLRRTHQTMKLENQALTSPQLKKERTRLIDEILRGDPRRLWDV